MLSDYAQKLVNSSTCCHTVGLFRQGKSYVGIYNGLSNWGRVEDGQGNLVEHLGTEDNDPNFSERDFELAGYTIRN